MPPSLEALGIVISRRGSLLDRRGPDREMASRIISTRHTVAPIPAMNTDTIHFLSAKENRTPDEEIALKAALELDENFRIYLITRNDKKYQEFDTRLMRTPEAAAIMCKLVITQAELVAFHQAASRIIAEIMEDA